MGNRGQKRPEMVDEFPADKRACSSLEFRASSSNPMNSRNSMPEGLDGDMDTSSSASGSTRSEGEGDKDSAYGSCDSDGEQRQNILHDYQRRRSSSDQGKFNQVLTSLGQVVDESETLATLTELCELLSFCADGALSSLMADSLSPILVKLARHESNPDIMLLAIRAITYLCDVHPRSSGFLVRHDAVPALCQRLIAVEYLDVAEQCLQALEKISHEEPLACLQSGAIMAVLTHIDFFSTSIQRVALSSVVNICKKLPSECPSPFMEAVPILCNLLRYEDRQLVENVATSLIKIAERVQDNSDMLDELCKHELVHHAVHLIDVKCRTTLCQPLYTGLIGLLVKLASGSILAFRTLFELRVSSILKAVLSTYDLSQGMVSPNMMVDGHCNQMHEILKLLNQLLPNITEDHSGPLNTEKEAFLVNKPDNLQKFGMDLLSVLIQVVNSGANLYDCYGSLSVINKFIYFSKSVMLLELLKETNISSFLAGVFTRKDHHVLILALQIAATILSKLSDNFLNSFLKEGVYFAVDALLTPEKCSQFLFPLFGGIQLSDDSNKKCATRNLRCLCYAFDSGLSSASETGTCRLEKDSVHSLAKQISTNYFATEVLKTEEGLTDVLQKLRTLAAALTDLINMSMGKDGTELHEEFYTILHEIMAKLNGKDPISTFEFIESGIVKAIVKYLSNGEYLRENTELSSGFDCSYNVERRFLLFGRLLLSSIDAPLEDLPLLALARKLLTALSSVENFPIILNHSYKKRNSYAIVPHIRCTPYPCLRAQFMRGEGETCLSDYSEDVLTVDPFSSMDAIGVYLWPKVSKNRTGNIKPAAIQALCGLESSSQLPSDKSSPGCRSPDHMESKIISSDVKELEDKPDILRSAPEEGNSLRQTTSEIAEPGQGHMENRQHTSSHEDGSTSSETSESSGYSSNEDISPKLLFFLEGQQLDQASSLYQAILQQQFNVGREIVDSAKLWREVYKITYRRDVKSTESCSQDHQHQACDSSVSDIMGRYWQCTPFFSDTFVSKIASGLETSTPVHDVLFFLKSLECMNRFAFHLMTRQRMHAFAEGRTDNLDDLQVSVLGVPQNEFVSSKLTEKLEQQMRDPLAISMGSLPLWCSQLMTSCPFLFAFEVRCKYFRLAAFSQQQSPPHPISHNDSGGLNGRRQNASGLPRKRFSVCRNHILESATQMMDLYARQKAILEVEYNEEVGTGLGPTLEFYTLVSHEFQKTGLSMWREDHTLLHKTGMQAGDSEFVRSPCGLFPRPWLSTVSTLCGTEFSEVKKKFVLLGQVVAKALQDGRVLDIPFSKAFYKLMIGQELTVYDIHSFDPELARVLLEFQAVVERKRVLESAGGENSTFKFDPCFRNATIEDLYLDFSLPGYPDYVLTVVPEEKLVTMENLEEYVLATVDATINVGICRQVEAFKSGFNQVFSIQHLQVFTEEELERLLCGEREFCSSNEMLDHIKFDHGYTASSPPIINLLQIIREFDREQQRAFLQFVTGAPRLPPGGLASLNPKLTIVRKHCSRCADADLPSVMTCANYLKLPPYSSKETMKEKLLYAITEGQGSFHLS
ncbi:E3 ubiquitin-protein ligase UPL4 isoform X2 [Diospyros lotus]|uniref:E3 ubiquitin-protein ligase UPL4 isoform X2 n=1 Tax=Diospyros lotus TaxID=55363 RepID=UPI0022503978|nr:E3 ubiquitin-protein ligase UPL4 isoform X2 [Diospyros lotus]